MKVAIIGAGPSGLTSLKQCIDYGFDPVCFEKADNIGGIWRYKDQGNTTSVTQKTVAITSKHMMAFSDFPPPEEFPIFLHHRYYFHYLTMYAAHFKLRRCIKFRMEVVQVQQSADYSTTGQWDITFRDLRNGVTSTETFDGVFVASGLLSKARQPNFQGIETFKGRILHSQCYRKSSDFVGRRVLIVGFGHTACDIATSLAFEASQDGTSLAGIDDVIMCTGYACHMPFLNNALSNDLLNLQLKNAFYKLMYPIFPQTTKLQQYNTLCLVGLVVPFGSIAPVSEMQARFHCATLSGHTVLPDYATMKHQMENEIEDGCDLSTVEIRWLMYLDDLAKQIKVKPSVWSYLFKDTWFALKLCFLAALPYQYRLQGPHFWPGAKEVMSTIWKQTPKQLLKHGRQIRTVKVQSKPSCFSRSILKSKIIDILLPLAVACLTLGFLFACMIA